MLGQNRGINREVSEKMINHLPYKVFITAAVTGSGDTTAKHPGVPKSPEEIADAAIKCAKAGAAIVHCHVRCPITGKPSKDIKYYREVFRLIRAYLI